jgi:outer membrane protein
LSELRTTRRGARIACVCALWGSSLLAGARADVLADADALLRGGQAEAAVALLAPLEQARAGEPDYDAAYGAALLQAGHAARASIALERATIIDPTLAGARLDLAIAYFQMGALEDARSALLALRELAPPAQAGQVIDDYLARIARATARRHWSADLAFGSGYDSNANGATSLDEFLGFTLTETSRAAASGFYELAASGSLAQPLSHGVTLDAGLDLRARNNPRADFVDSTAAQALLGVHQDTRRGARSLVLIGYRLGTDGELNSRGTGLAARWLRSLGKRWSAGGFGRALAIRYGTDLEIKDVDQVAAGAELLHLWGLDTRGSVRLALQLGRDRAQDEGSPYGRKLYGLDADATWQTTPRLLAQAGVTWQRSRYDEAFFPSQLADRRADTLALARAGVLWQPAKAWSLEAALTHTRNRTNVDVFEYERTAVQLTARRQWR